LHKYRLGLIGYPLGHSLSPIMHHAALEVCQLYGEYRLYPIPPQEKNQLLELIVQLRNDKLDGLNITIPYKQQMLALVDILSSSAQAVGAINTIYRKDGILVGENTDAPGFWNDLQRLGWHEKKSSSQALIIGSGGSARAVTYVLAKNGWRVILAARHTNEAKKITSEIISAVSKSSGSIQVITLDANGLRSVPECDLIVNATPVGMIPDSDISPWPGGVPFPQNACVYDLVYNPTTTLLMRQGVQAGLRVTNGLGMLIEQAALAFTQWTGLVVNPELMRKAVETHLESEKA